MFVFMIGIIRRIAYRTLKSVHSLCLDLGWRFRNGSLSGNNDDATQTRETVCSLFNETRGSSKFDRRLDFFLDLSVGDHCE